MPIRAVHPTGMHERKTVGDFVVGLHLNRRAILLMTPFVICCGGAGLPEPPEPRATPVQCQRNNDERGSPGFENCGFHLHYCWKEGRCFWNGTNCVAKCADDCRISDLCAKFGTCTAFNDRCYPATEDECTRACSSLGLCTRVGHVCVAKTSADCLQSKLCTTYGTCTAANGHCVVGSDADCKRAQVCIEGGGCSRHDDAEQPYCAP